jgi:hypothetical protein
MGQVPPVPGGAAISVITAGELWTWVQRGNASLGAKKTVTEFIDSMDIIPTSNGWLTRIGPQCKPRQFD